MIGKFMTFSVKILEFFHYYGIYFFRVMLDFKVADNNISEAGPSHANDAGLPLMRYIPYQPSSDE